MSKYVYFFSKEKTDGNRNLKDLLGGKGANLAEMTNINLPVPPGFTISTEACEVFYSRGKKWPESMEAEIRDNVKMLEKVTSRKFGDYENPLFVSVRSGAAVSMPGMMDTVLNLGLNENTIQALAKKSGSERFAWDSYRRFIQMFGDVVMDIPHHQFEEILQNVKDEKKVSLDTELDTNALREIINRYKELYNKSTNQHFPEDPWQQLVHAINAVLNSWNNARAIRYRQLNGITDLKGTAVNIQMMVFGNTGESSGTGVCFTRDPSTGENVFYGEYLLNAQGEDVVAGIRTPQPLSTLKEWDRKAYNELIEIRKILENHYKDMQDMEFTIENHELFILQTRTGKRTIFAALNMAVDMVDEGLIDRETAISRVPAESFSQLFAPILSDRSKKKAKLIAKGLNASPGGASGKAVFSADDAEEWAARGEKVILCRLETSPEDIGGMAVAQGILTATGGMTSHAAVVARGMGIPCVAGANDLIVNAGEKTLRSGDVTVREGDLLALDGFTGEVFSGSVKVRESEIVLALRGEIEADNSILLRNYSRFITWADEIRSLKVRTNADTPKDAKIAILFGAEGIGLCRTEHMFFESDRITTFRKMILVADGVRRLRQAIEEGTGNREKLEAELNEPLAIYYSAVEELLPLQREDFYGIFKALDGKPCTIRLLDPPLHEFIPHNEEGQRQVAEGMGISFEKVRETVESLKEFNPMLGHRGCRLGLTYPEVSDMQVKAIMEAAILVREEGMDVRPEIMIPLVGHWKELQIARKRAESVISRVLEEKGKSSDFIEYSIGTMIEIPRAAVTADQIAEYADFFSFGTNDLTQMGCGFSRDDAGRFLGDYVRMGIYDRNPFAVLDQAGIGRLVSIACENGRKARPGIKIGVCGEHGGEPSSIDFFHRVGLDYVSCSPYRVPIARLAAAQAEIRKKTDS